MEFITPTWFFNVILITNLIVAIFATITLLRSKLDTFSKIVFLLLIWFIPIIGSIIYFVLNTQKLKKSVTI